MFQRRAPLPCPLGGEGALAHQGRTLRLGSCPSATWHQEATAQHLQGVSSVDSASAAADFPSSPAHTDYWPLR